MSAAGLPPLPRPPIQIPLRPEDLDPAGVSGRLHDAITVLPTDPRVFTEALKQDPRLLAGNALTEYLSSAPLGVRPDTLLAPYGDLLANVPGAAQAMNQAIGGILAGGDVGATVQGILLTQVNGAFNEAKQQAIGMFRDFLIGVVGQAGASGAAYTAGASILASIAVESILGALMEDRGPRRRAAALRFVMDPDLKNVGLTLLEARWLSDPSTWDTTDYIPPGSALVWDGDASGRRSIFGKPEQLNPVPDAGRSVIAPWEITKVLKSITVTPKRKIAPRDLRPQNDSFGAPMLLSGGLFQWLNPGRDLCCAVGGTSRPGPTGSGATIVPEQTIRRLVDEKGNPLPPILYPGSVYRIGIMDDTIEFVPGWIQ